MLGYLRCVCGGGEKICQIACFKRNLGMLLQQRWIRIFVLAGRWLLALLLVYAVGIFGGEEGAMDGLEQSIYSSNAAVVALNR